MARKRDFKRNPNPDFKPVDELDQPEARREVAALREGIDHHDHLYYVEGKPAISDAIYDKLFARLEELEEAFPDLQDPNSPTRRVGAEPLDELAKVRHTAPMLSLNAALEEAEISSFCRNVEEAATDSEDTRYVLEPKFDGVSVELVYRDGVFEHGATRGDGETGEDVSENLRTIGAVPLRLHHSEKPPGMLAVRGEVFIGREGFREMNRERVERNEEPYANPRNAASGILRRLESRIVARWPLDLFVYDILAIDDDQASETHWEEFDRIDHWGLKSNPHRRRVASLDEIRDFKDDLAETREGLAYEIDGLVIKVDSLRLREALGTRHRSPRWAMAWKFAPREELTTLEDIVVQVGMTGMLTPVALLRPVDVGGVTVSRATLHNEGEVQRKDVRPGDRVRIARAGDVIPEVVERVKQPGVKRAGAFSMPRHCPVCDTEAVRDGAYWFCPAGLACRSQLVGHLRHYGAREALDIGGLGDKTARQLVEAGLVRDLAALYQLTVPELRGLDGFAEKSARRLHDAIRESAEPRLDRFLFALGIRHVGRRTARLLAEAFHSLDNLRRTPRSDLEAVPEIGPETAASVRQFFDAPANRDTLERMRELGVKVQPMPERRRAASLDGKKFVFTGTLREMDRQEAKEAVRERGGHDTSSVSGETDFLVVGEKPGATKTADAEKHHTRIIDETEFRRILKH